MDGLGVLIYPYDGKSIIGEWKNGKEWNTKHTKKDGTLIGNYVSGKYFLVMYRVWKGTKMGHVWQNKMENKKEDGMYLGEIENGKPNGVGILSFHPSFRYFWKYEVEWKDGKKHGQGKYTYRSGATYKGMWKNNKENGEGILTFTDGRKWEGKWKDRERWNVTSRNRDGIVIGRWLDGVKVFDKKREGVLYNHYDVNFNTDSDSKQNCSNIRCSLMKNDYGTWEAYYEGDLIYDYIKKGKKYVGEIENGLPNGKGRMTGDIFGNYVGEFKDGLFHGQGTFTKNDNLKKDFGPGEKFVGEWKDGKKWKGITYDKDVNIIYRWVNGNRKYHNLYKTN